MILDVKGTWSASVKRPNSTWRAWHQMRARDEYKRSFRKGRPRAEEHSFRPFKVELWDGHSFRNAICIKEARQPPGVICLTENRDDTLGFLNLLRTSLAISLRNGEPVKKSWTGRALTGSKLPRISGFTDFSSIERIGTAAAVVIAAEYDRARRIMGTPPPTVNISDWSDAAFRTLFELGFFDVVGLTGETEHRYAETSTGDVLVMSMISGENGNQLPDVSEAIRQLTGFIYDGDPMRAEMLKHLNSAIGEAMINVRRHAYQPPFSSDVAYVPRWWFTAEANRGSRRLTAVLYDQGATIPVTLPYKHRSWLDVLLRGSQDAAPVSQRDQTLVNAVDTDPEAIKYAMKEGTTQTDDLGRGRGLPQMRDLIKKYGGGRLTVISRSGYYVYASDAGTYTEKLTTPLGGTLVEWEVELPR